MPCSVERGSRRKVLEEAMVKVLLLFLSLIQFRFSGWRTHPAQALCRSPSPASARREDAREIHIRAGATMRRRPDARRPIEIASMRQFASLTRRMAGAGIRRAGPRQGRFRSWALGGSTPTYVSIRLSGARASGGGGILTIKMVVARDKSRGKRVSGLTMISAAAPLSANAFSFRQGA